VRKGSEVGGRKSEVRMVYRRAAEGTERSCDLFFAERAKSKQPALSLSAFSVSRAQRVVRKGSEVGSRKSEVRGQGLRLLIVYSA
jgi:hypothetical protein